MVHLREAECVGGELLAGVGAEGVVCLKKRMNEVFFEIEHMFLVFGWVMNIYTHKYYA